MCFCSNKTPVLILANGDRKEDGHASSRGWSKSRMWSQYAENHRGVCLVFSKAALQASLCGGNHHPKFEAHHVQYYQEGGFHHGTTNLDGNRLEEEDTEQYALSHVLERADEFFFRKHIDYRDESEFRFVVFDAERRMEYLDIQSSLKGVVIGDRTPEVYTPLVNNLCDEIGIPVRKAYWSKDEFQLLLSKPEQ